MKDYQKYFGWSDKKLAKEIKVVKKAISKVTNFEPAAKSDKDPSITNLV